MMSNYENRAMKPAGPKYRVAGVVTHWNRDKGWGFLRRDDGRPDIFAHVSNVVEDVDALCVGDRVEFTPGTDSRNGKPEALDVRLIESDDER